MEGSEERAENSSYPFWLSCGDSDGLHPRSAARGSAEERGWRCSDQVVPKVRTLASAGIAYTCRISIAMIIMIGDRLIPAKITGKCSRTKSNTGSVKL